MIFERICLIVSALVFAASAFWCFHTTISSDEKLNSAVSLYEQQVRRDQEINEQTKHAEDASADFFLPGDAII